MPNCSVKTCKNTSKTSNLQKNNTTFHLFPKHMALRAVRAAWIQACGLPITWVPKRTNTICSHHFKPSCFIFHLNNKRRLKQNAVPSLKLAEVRKENNCIKISPNITEIKEPRQDTTEIKYLEPSSTASNSELLNSQIFTDKNLRKCLETKNKQIKRLQSQNTYLKKKVSELKENLKHVQKKIKLIKTSLTDSIELEEKELL